MHDIILYVTLSLPPSLSLWPQDVCHDANLRVSLTKVLKPDHLVVVIFLTNQKQSEQSEVTLAIEPPSNMKVYKHCRYSPFSPPTQKKIGP